MAKTRETAVVDVMINNEIARKKVQELSTEFDVLRKKKFEALSSGNDALSKSIQQEITVIKKELRQYQKQTLDVDNVLRNLNKVPLNQLQLAQRLLRSQMQTMNRDSMEYLQTQKKILKIERELSSVQGKKGNSLMSKIGMYAGGVATISALENLGHRSIDTYASLDDKMADVQKTTGRTKDEVKELDKELLKIETRTSREGLLDLARIGGKLGYSDIDELGGFVRATDQIKVALAEDLGDNVEDAIGQLGKLTEIFKIKEDLGIEKSLMSVGSAINSLGAASNANEGYIVDFTSRTAGVAPGANISIQNVMGLGAAIDNLGQSSEVAGTTYSQVITGMFKKTDEYAKIAEMSLADFQALLNYDANEAFLKVLEGINGDGGMQGITKKLSSLKLEGTRSTQVLGALAGNIDLVRSQQELANIEFGKATSITDEYNTKNQSAAAVLEMRKKKIEEAMATLGEKIIPLWSETLGLTGNTLQALGSIVGWLIKYKGVLVAVGIAILANIVLKNKDVIISKLQIFWSKAHGVALTQEVLMLRNATLGTKLLSAAKLLLVGNVRAAGMAFKMFFASIGPIGWITLAIGALGSAIAVLAANTNTVAKSAKDLSSITKSASDSLVEEKLKMEDLLRTASDKNISDGKRKQATLDLQGLIPDGIKLINDETVANGKAKQAVDEYCKSLLVKAKIQAGEEKLIELEKERLNSIEDGSATSLSLWQQMGVAIRTGILPQSIALEYAMGKALSNFDKFEKETDVRRGNIVSKIREWRKEIDNVSFSTPSDNGGESGNGGDGNSGSEESKGIWSLDRDEAFLTEKIELRKKLNSGEIATEDEYNNQLLAMEIEYLDKRIVLQKEKGADMANLQETVAEKRYQQTKSETMRLEKLLAASLEGSNDGEISQLYTKENFEYEKRLKALGLFNMRRETMSTTELSALLNLEKNHTNRLQEIYADRLIREFQSKEKEFKRSLSQLQIKHNDELASANSFAKKKALINKYFGSDEANQVRTDKEADRRLKQYYQKIEQDDARRHLESLLSDYKKVMTNINAVDDNGISLGMLNPEEVDRIQALIDNLNKQLAELRGTTPTSENNDLEKVDILGFSASDWEGFFSNLNEGKGGLDAWRIGLEAIGNTFGVISNLMTAVEQREFKEYEKTAKKKKQSLDKQLRSELISQDNYNAAVQRIDEETESKRDEMEKKQARRQKAQAVYQALISTALAIMTVVSHFPFPASIPFIAAVSALGAIQVATILATPLPGAEEGGEIGVIRKQDGRRFLAKNDPQCRGAVSSPTVLVAENGTEYVVPNEGYENPSIRPVLDVMERARRNGTLGTINLQAAIATSASGRVAGGYTSRVVGNGINYENSVGGSSSQVDQLIEMISANTKMTHKLHNDLVVEGIDARVALLGKNGIRAKTQEYENIVNQSEF